MKATKQPRWIRWSADVFGCDRRSLALFRMVIGTLLLADLALRFGDIPLYYTDSGAFSREICRDSLPAGFWSLHLLDGSASFQAGLFVVAACFAVLLVLGCFTRVVTIASWVLLVSLHVRHTMILNSGDTLLRMLLFWSMFLPLGSCWSFDSWWRKWRSKRRDDTQVNERSPVVLSGATFAIIVQLFIMYWFTGIAKWHPGWLEGGALVRVLHVDLLVKPFGILLRDAPPQILAAVSIATVWLEVFGPLLLLIPKITKYARAVMIVAFFGLHISIYMSLSVGLFSFISMAAWLPLIPSFVWNWISNLFRRRKAQQVTARAHQVSCEPSGWSGVALGTLGISLTFYLLAWNCNNSEQLDSSKNTAIAGSYKRAHGLFNQNWLGPESSSYFGPGTPLRLLMAAQEFEMFGQVPSANHWFVYRARLRNGKVVDLLTGEEALNGRPDDVYASLPSHRSRKFHRNMMHLHLRKYALPQAEYYCRQWNANHGEEEQITRLDLIAYLESTEPDRTVGNFTEVRLATVELATEDDELDELERMLLEMQEGGLRLP